MFNLKLTEITPSGENGVIVVRLAKTMPFGYVNVTAQIHIPNMEGMIANRLSNLGQTLLLAEMKQNLVIKALLVQVKVNEIKTTSLELEGVF